MPQTQGYSEKGSQYYGVHDWCSKERVNDIYAIINPTFLTLSLVIISLNAEVFHA